MRMIAVLTASVLFAARARAGYLTDKAVELAAAKAVEGMKLGELKSVAVLPLWGDDGYAADMVKGALTRGGVQVLVRSEEEWKNLLDEISWNVKREDIMDAATIQRFGKIEGCDGVLYGTLRGVERSLWAFRASARLSVHVADVETGRIVWSSGPVEGESFAHWSDVAVRFWEYPAVWVVVLVVAGVAVVVWILKRAVRPR